MTNLRDRDLKGVSKVLIPVVVLVVLVYDVLPMLTGKLGDTISEVIFWDWSIGTQAITPAIFAGALVRHLFWPLFFDSPDWSDRVRFWSFVSVMLGTLVFDLTSSWRPPVPPVFWLAVGFIFVGSLWPMPGRS